MTKEDKKRKFITPAERFFSNAEAETIASESEKEMQERQLPLEAPKPENRTRRVQAYLTPTLHKNATNRAKAEGLSLNDLINISLEEYINKQ